MGGKSQKIPGKGLLKVGTRTAQFMEPSMKALGADVAAISRQLLTTGGTEATVPMIRQAREEAMLAGSGAEDVLRAQLAASGLEGTPYAAALQTAAKMQTGMTASKAEQDATGRFATAIFPSLAQAPVQAFAPMMGVANAPLNAAAAYPNQGGGAGYAALGSGVGGIVGSVGNTLLQNRLDTGQWWPSQQVASATPVGGGTYYGPRGAEGTNFSIAKGS